MNREQTDYDILLVAEALSQNTPKESIVEFFTMEGLSHDEIYLLIVAGEFLYRDRINAPPPKTIFRRVV